MRHKRTKSRERTTRRAGVVAALALTLWALPSVAADPSDASDGWHFGLTPYLWAASLEGDVATLSSAPTVDVDASFSDILDNTDLTLMLFGELRYERIGFSADLNYLSLSVDEGTPGPSFGGVELESDTFFTTLAGSYRLIESDRGVLDVVGGLRLWDVRTVLEFDPGIVSGLRTSDDDTWVDPIAGARASLKLPGPFFLSAAGDAGAGASDITWQALGTLDLHLGSRFDLRLGYRYLSVDYDHGGFVWDVDMSGPILGAAFRL